MLYNILPKFRINLSKFCQMRLNSFLFRFLPFSVSRWYLHLLGRLYFFINRKEKLLITRTITQAARHFTTPRPLAHLLKATIKGTIDHYHEKLFIGYSRFKSLLRFLKARIGLAGEASLRLALCQGKGVILVTGHFGAVEFLPAALALNGYPVTMICRFQTNRLRHALMERAGRVDIQLIDANECNVFLAALKALKQGRILVTECDEFDEWRNGSRKVSFLGAGFTGDRTLDILQKRSGAPVVSALMHRHERKGYTLNLAPILVDSKSNPVWIGEQCLGLLEQNVQAFPEQWYQWKKFGKMIHVELGEELERDRQASGYLAPQTTVSVTG